MSGNHDDHYADKSIQPIDEIEEVMEKNTDIPVKNRYSVAQSIKYIRRAGTKEGEDWKKDLRKAMNYLNRAITGEWL